ncbi:hypothetical protein KC851_03675 [Candidatus Kaiserbacteria bacterium]|nr:hypothetical protein [Candidatus Kaiserbacteria bacterium]
MNKDIFEKAFAQARCRYPEISREQAEEYIQKLCRQVALEQRRYPLTQERLKQIRADVLWALGWPDSGSFYYQMFCVGRLYFENPDSKDADEIRLCA